MAGEILEALRKAGVRLKDLDRGCHRLDLTKAGSEGERVNLRGKIEACEVFEFVLDHPRSHPLLSKRLAGGPIPWELDDGNSATDFDAKVRGKLRSAIDQVDAILAGQGLSPQSTAYQEKMAVALYYFVVYPLDPSRDLELKNWRHYGKKELYSLGLGNFHENFLLKKGGLGRITVQGFDGGREYSALQAIKNNQGWCTEWSKVLYGVYQMAGLHSFFASTQLDPKTLGAQISSLPDATVLDHIFVGLSLGNRTRFFDVSRYNPDVKYSRYYRYHLRHYLSDDLSNRGVDEAKNKNNLPKAETILKYSLELNPDNHLSNYNLGLVLRLQGRVKEALPYFERAIKLDGAYVPALEELGFTYAALDETQKAHEVFEKVLELDPLNQSAKEFLKK